MPQNHLTHCTSPYLQQHVNNPIDWYPWTEEALNKAKQENKPIFLSIGYSACHWCHVMAHESFEDTEIAKILNKYFINIKVDREERPDLDKIYQISHQILTGQNGGWPLSMFLSGNNLMPFFSGTYFPKEQRFNLPGFKQLILKIHDFYLNHQTEITAQDQQLKLALEKLGKIKESNISELSEEPIKKALLTIENNFDRHNGGFYKEPKFPHPAHLQFLLNYYSDNPTNNLQDIITLTLNKMAFGGIYDQIGGGFFRYSIDQYWMIPHFEKMLYDNAQLISIYTTAAKLLRHDKYQQIALEIIEWAMREMYSPEGAFYSTLDADVDGEEGKYYIWNQSDILTALSTDEYSIFEKLFLLNQGPNFGSHWHLHGYSQLNPNDLMIWKQGQKKLLLAREKRKKPHRDEKILTSWNAMMIQALALAGQLFNRDDLILIAKKNLAFIQSHLYKNKQLYASYKDNQLGQLAYLDDYVYLINALLQLLQIDFDKQYWEFTIELAETICEKFYDQDNQGFYFTSIDQDKLFHRHKSFIDEAIPSGNGIAAQVLLKLGYLAGNINYIEKAEKTLLAAWHIMENFPDAGLSSITALYDFLNPSKRIILSGDKQHLNPWLTRYFENYNSRDSLYSFTNETKIPDIFKQYAPKKEHVTAYICQGTQCTETITNIEQFK
jgi:uncharacterized protein YyaL (SSP411 family)